MTLTVDQYNKLFKYCESLIKSKSFIEGKRITNFDPADLANETFVICIDKDILEEKSINNIAYGVFMNEWQKAVSKLSYNDSLPNLKNTYIDEETIVCNKCKTPHPVSMYRTSINKNGYKRTSCMCKKCEDRRQAEYYLKNKKTCLLYNKEYQKKNKSQLRKTQKQYWEREIDALSDMYIKWVLRNTDKIPQEVIDACPNMIEERRHVILHKRNGNKRGSDSAPKMVVKITMSGERIAAFKSLSEAGKDLDYLNYSNCSKRIGEVISGRRDSFMGFRYEHHK